MPLETIYLLGAGHIAKYVAALGGDLDFRIVIVDPRTGWNDAVRFPEADTLVVQDYAEAFPKLEIRPIDYVIIVTPSHVSDEKCVQLALETPAKYIGMIGSKRKVKLIKEQLQQKGITAVSLKRLHAPIGIDIAAETPAEIAVSILAEIIQIRRSPPTHT